MARSKSTELRRRKHTARRAREKDLSLQEIVFLRQSNAIVNNSGNLDIVGRNVHKSIRISRRILKQVARGSSKTRVRRHRLIQLTNEQNHRCCYCGQQSWHPEIEDYDTVKHSRWNRATLEHIIPLVHGGSNGKHNLVMACSQCNGARGTKSIDYFITLISTDINVPISKRVKRKMNKDDKSERKFKEAKMLKLLLIGAIFTPDLFKKILVDFKPHKRKPRTGRCHVTAIRKRVIENNMVF
jgi:hypothetical protein